MAIYDAKRIAVREYAIETEKAEKPVRAVIVADLHSASYGEGNRDLAELIISLSPDLVLFPGDTDDGVKSHIPAINLTERLSASLPCYLILGNHELLLRSEKRIAQQFKRAGALLLKAESCVFTAKNSQKIAIAGVFDRWCVKTERPTFHKEIAKAAEGIDRSLFSILLAHRPELHGMYLAEGFDLAISGHAHGGQWRIGAINGVWAPGQGLLPKYAGGLYSFEGGGKLLVSRGLALGNTWVPRFGNPPELCILDILPKNPTVDNLG